MNGCMSEVLRSFFSYQVAVGSTMSEYSAVVHMRKSSVTSRSSLPSGASSTPLHFLWLGCAALAQVLALQAMAGAEQVLEHVFVALARQPSRLERQMNMLRGKFSGASGSA